MLIRCERPGDCRIRPRGHLVTSWDAGAGNYLSSASVVDGSGVAPAGQAGEFLASSGSCGMLAIDAWRGAARPLETAFLQAGRWGWDNHLVAAAARALAAHP